MKKKLYFIKVLYGTKVKSLRKAIMAFCITLLKPNFPDLVQKRMPDLNVKRLVLSSERCKV